MCHVASEHFGDGGKHSCVGYTRAVFMEPLQALHADAVVAFCKPVDGLVDQAGVVTTIAGCGQNEGLGVDDAYVIGVRVSRNTNRRPLVP